MSGGRQGGTVSPWSSGSLQEVLQVPSLREGGQRGRPLGTSGWCRDRWEGAACRASVASAEVGGMAPLHAASPSAGFKNRRRRDGSGAEGWGQGSGILGFFGAHPSCSPC